MNSRLCVRFGTWAGGWVAILALLHNAPGPTPTLLQMSFIGVVLALIGMFFAAPFACMVIHLSPKPVYFLAIFVGIVVGGLLGPIAYHIPNAALALTLCALLGALIGWAVCRVICPVESILREMP
jgi:NAD/NADP transhydrogenase beta subunit